MSTILEIAASVMGLVSGGLWFWAARAMPTPPYLGGAYLMDKLPDPNTPWKRAWDRSTRLNAMAAICTGCAAILGAAGTMLAVLHN